MKFDPLPLHGAYRIELEPMEDERGFFSRSFCQKEFSSHGLPYAIRQSNISYNPKMRTLRGMHFQKPPHSEPKLVRCIHGCIYDVMVDLRPDSATFCQHYAWEMDAADLLAVYVPPQFAHGFITLTSEVLIHYEMFESFHPEFATGFRYDDPVFDIEWPVEPEVISEKDQNWSPFNPEDLTSFYRSTA